MQARKTRHAIDLTIDPRQGGEAGLTAEEVPGKELDLFGWHDTGPYRRPEPLKCKARRASRSGVGAQTIRCLVRVEVDVSPLLAHDSTEQRRKRRVRSELGKPGVAA